MIEEYIVPLDRSDVLALEDRVSRNGADEVLKYQFHFLDCSRTVNGIRAMQTIDYTYHAAMSETIYLLDKYFPDREDLEKQLIDIHNANLEYEKDNPPKWYSKKHWTKEKVSKPKTKREPKEKVKQVKLLNLKLNLKLPT